jgi:Fe2+ transport system protein B
LISGKQPHTLSEDEKSHRDILLKKNKRKYRSLIQKHKRSLSITLQHRDGASIILDLNMRDEALDRGINIKEDELKNSRVGDCFNNSGSEKGIDS